MKRAIKKAVVASLAFAMVSWGAAVNDDGGSGGGFLTPRSAQALQEFLHNLRAQRDAARVAQNEQELQSWLERIGLAVS